MLDAGIFTVVAIVTQVVYAKAHAVGPASVDAWAWRGRMVLLAAAVSIGLHLKAGKRSL